MTVAQDVPRQREVVERCRHPKVHRHGEHRTYNTKCCRCSRCTMAHTLRRRELSRLRVYGRWTRWYPEPDKVRSHLQALLDSGSTMAVVAQRAGVSQSTLQRFKGSPDVQIMNDTAEAVLGLEAVPRGKGALVAGIGTQRRLEALVALRWDLTELSRRKGHAANYYRRVMQRAIGLGHVRVHVDQEVRELYREFSGTPGNGRERDHGYAPPLAWEYIDMDDPESTPVGTPLTRLKQKERIAGWVEDATYLAGEGATCREVAERLGITRDALERTLKRHRREVYHLLVQNRARRAA